MTWILADCSLVNERTQLKCQLAEFTGQSVLCRHKHSYSVESHGSTVKLPIPVEHPQVQLSCQLLQFLVCSAEPGYSSAQHV